MKTHLVSAMHRSLLIAAFATCSTFTVAGYAQEQVPNSTSGTEKSATGEPCMSNYSESGNFFTARTFRTYQIIPAVKFSDAFKRVYARVAQQGATITNHDKELGVITGTLGANGEGKLNINIEDIESTGVKVTVKLFVSPSFYNDNKWNSRLCGFVAAAAGDK